MPYFYFLDTAIPNFLNHLSPSSHTQWSIVKPPRVPRDAVFNSRSQSRAMLGCVERKNASNAKKLPAL